MNGTIKGLSFTKRDIPVPPDYRPMYKIAHILLILHMCCRGGKASMMKLHFLCWSIKTRKNIAIVNSWIKNNFSNHLHVWGIEPTVNRALTFAVAERLILNVGGDFILSESGTALVKSIVKDKQLFIKEKDFLTTIGKGIITEQKVRELAAKFF